MKKTEVKHKDKTHPTCKDGDPTKSHQFCGPGYGQKVWCKERKKDSPARTVTREAMIADLSDITVWLSNNFSRDGHAPNCGEIPVVEYLFQTEQMELLNEIWEVMIDGYLNGAEMNPNKWADWVYDGPMIGLRNMTIDELQEEYHAAFELDGTEIGGKTRRAAYKCECKDIAEHQSKTYAECEHIRIVA